MVDRPECETCPYWDMKEARHLSFSGYGECRRHANHTMSKYGDNWCGEHPDFPKYLRAREEAELEKLPKPF